MFCRDAIAAVLKDVELNGAEELAEFRRRVQAADRRFQALAVEGAQRTGRTAEWWRRVIVRRAGKELAADLFSEYGARVEVVDEGPKLP
jgi:hypothetical protein